MASSACPSCKKTSFEYAEIKPSSTSPVWSGQPMVVVQCSSCGAIVGVVDWLLRDMVRKLIGKRGS